MKTILLAVDFSPVTDAAVAAAAHLAGALGARLALLHVAPPDPEFLGYEPGPASVRQAVAHRLSDQHHKLDALRDRLLGQGLEVEAMFRQGYAAERILSEATRLESDMIVMGSHGHGGLHHLLMGSVAEGVLRKAHCPVVLVPSANGHNGR